MKTNFSSFDMTCYYVIENKLLPDAFVPRRANEYSIIVLNIYYSREIVNKCILFFSIVLILHSFHFFSTVFKQFFPFTVKTSIIISPCRLFNNYSNLHFIPDLIFRFKKNSL